MNKWLRTNRRLRSEVDYLQGRLNAAAEERRALVVRPGPLPAAAPAAPPATRPNIADVLQGRINALEKLKTTAGAVELAREARAWRERAGAVEERLRALQSANEAADVDLKRVTGQLTVANAQLSKMGWHTERRVVLP